MTTTSMFSKYLSATSNIATTRRLQVDFGLFAIAMITAFATSTVTIQTVPSKNLSLSVLLTTGYFCEKQLTTISMTSIVMFIATVTSLTRRKGWPVAVFFSVPSLQLLLLLRLLLLPSLSTKAIPIMFHGITIVLALKVPQVFCNLQCLN